MHMATFTELKAEVQTNIIDLPPAVTANVGKYVNRAIKSAERRYNFKYMDAETTLITVEETLSLGSLSQFKEWRDRGPYVLQQFAPAYQIYMSDNTREQRMTFTLNTDFPDRPRYIRISSLDSANTVALEVSPYPDANSDWDDGNYRVVLPYYRYTGDLSGNSDSTWLTVNGEEYIIERATAYGFQADWDVQNAALWEQWAKNKFEEIKLTDKKMRLSGFDTLVISPNGANAGMVQR
jgi:hypothetical protein